MPNKAINIKRQFYTMASSDGVSGEIELYGDIYQDTPRYYNGDPVEGRYISLEQFLEDLNALKKCKDITLRINSYGGDAAAADTIHNRLRELARAGTKLTCIVDGVAMSGGSLIMCSCDTVCVNPSSLIMIHRAWECLWGAFNVDEIQKELRFLEAYDKMQATIYNRKTGIPEEELLAMMSETTILTGREAFDKKFADEVLEDADPLDIAASADGKALICGGIKCYLPPGTFAPDSVPTAKQPEAEINDIERSNEMNTKSNEAPAERVDQSAETAGQAANMEAAIDEAVRAERQRLSEIDEIAALYPEDMVRAAKYGEHPCTAQQLAYNAAQAAVKQGTNVLALMNADAKAAAKVGAAPDPKAESGSTVPEAPKAAKTENEKIEEARALLKQALGKKED